MSYLDEALEWVNQERAFRGLPTLAEWPENAYSGSMDRSRTCPVAQALGAQVGFSIAIFDPEDNSKDVSLPLCVQEAIMIFDSELQAVDKVAV